MTKYFDTDLFIKEIHKRKSIWDTSSADHANRELKRRNWDEIVNIFGGNNMSATNRHVLGFTLRNRWKNIRTSFARELKRQKNYGSGVGRKSEYIYYKQLLFLKNVMNIVEKEMDEEPEYVYYDDNDIDLKETTVLEKFKNRVSDEDTSSDREDRGETTGIKNKCKQRVSNDDAYSDKEEDEDKLFLLSLHKTMKRIPTNKKINVKIKMLSILNEVLDEEERLCK